MRKSAIGLGVGLPIGSFGDEGRGRVSVGLPYGLGVHYALGDPKEYWHPNLGLGLLGPMIGFNYGQLGTRKQRQKQKAKEELEEEKDVEAVEKEAAVLGYRLGFLKQAGGVLGSVAGGHLAGK